MLPPPVERSVERHLTMVDHLRPGAITGFYVVGSPHRQRSAEFVLAVADAARTCSADA